MNSRTEAVTDKGISGRLNWFIGGALGGLVGAVIFAGLLWLVDPTTVTESIPQMYGFEGGRLMGWVFHISHGVIFGVIFGFIITRNLVLGILTADVDTPFLDSLSLNVRMMGAGLVYGLSIWAFVTGFVLMVTVTLGDISAPLPLASASNLIGHLLYGIILGALVSVFTDVEVEAHESEAPFEESSDTHSKAR